MPVRIPFWDGMGVSMADAVGDKDWAKRIAKEYKIKVPKAKNNGKAVGNEAK